MDSIELTLLNVLLEESLELRVLQERRDGGGVRREGRESEALSLCIGEGTFCKKGGDNLKPGHFVLCAVRWLCLQTLTLFNRHPLQDCCKEG